MELRFLTPWAGLLALSALVPLAVFVLRQRRARQIRAALDLRPPARRSWLPLAVALAAVPGLVGLAATQPVLEESRQRLERADAEIFVVLDVTRSMLASADPEAPTRFQRAQRLAVQLRDDFPEVPIGVVSLTDRVLPHAFPTTDRRVFVSTVEESVEVDRPGSGIGGTVVTELEALKSIPELNYFSPRAEHRVLVAFTDGESLPLEGGLSAAYRKTPPIETMFVQLWDENERIYETGVAEGTYRPRANARPTLDRVASLVGGRVFAEDEIDEVSAAARGVIGDQGKTRQRTLEGERLALMPWVTLAALLPLGFLLLRRNF